MKRVNSNSRILIFLFVAAFLLIAPKAHVFATTVGTNTYTWWYWPSTSSGYDSFVWTLTPEYEASTANGVFWAHQFSIKGGNGGYLGLQNNGSDPSGKIAIFSIWDALDSESSEYASTFGGEGTGYTARIQYEWEVDTTYRLFVSYDGNDGMGDWWKAEIEDASTGVKNTVGRIKVPSEWDRLKESSVMWTESYLSLSDCSELEFTGAVFGTPLANDSVAPTSHSNNLQNNKLPDRTYCPGSYSVDIEEGVRHWMGAPYPPPEDELEEEEEEDSAPDIADNSLVRASNSDKIYIVKNGKRHHIPDMATLEARAYDLAKLQIVDASTLSSIPESYAFFPEGAVISAKGNEDVWIIKYSGDKQFRRLILNPSVFESYGHLRWEDIIEVDASALDAFTVSDLVRTEDGRVYRLFPDGDTGEKRWIKTADAFNSLGFDWDAIYTINDTDRNFYTEGIEIQ